MARSTDPLAAAPALRWALGITMLIVLVLTGCEGVFTTSPLSFLQRDPANLSPEQQVQFGEDALSSGDPEAMAEAYEVLKGSTDAQTQLLAADLALGAVELESAVTEAVAGISSGGDEEETLEAVLAGFTDEDLAMMAEAAALVDAADESVQPTPEQYTFAAIGLLAVAASENDGDIASIGGTEEAAKAQAFLDAAVAQLQASGESTDLLDGIQGIIP